jgi:hypothetical protein
LARLARPGGRSSIALPLALAWLVAVAGCVPSVSLPETCNQPTVSFTATLGDSRLEPSTFEVCRGQQVILTMTVEQDGIVHLHGYDDLLGAKEVRVGQTLELAFEAAHVGQYPIALHTLGGAPELTVGTLVVHDA